MTASFDAQTEEDLPDILPVFPLRRVILLPRIHLPLNIFEPRYIAMVNSALSSSRMIGVIQPRRSDDGGVFPVGCAGRITAFEDTEDGRYLVTLTGVCRFRIAEEMPTDEEGFRVVKPEWDVYKNDFQEDHSDICRDMMMPTLRAYFDKKNMFCDQWEHMQEVSCEKLVSTLSMVCPFEADEKQVLLEAENLKDRARILQSILENEIKGEDSGQAATH